MCGRYALALRPSQIMQMFRDEGLPVEEAPDDEGPGAPRQSYNFAPGYHGIVYRAETGDWGAGPGRDVSSDTSTNTKDGHIDFVARDSEVRYKLQSMKWGLVPFWTKKAPDYSTIVRTMNCRDDSLSTPGGMWTTMKDRKRCIVIAQGFFEWLKMGPKDKLPHYIKRKDGQLMCFAGLWDCTQYEDSEEKTYTYTIITTDANKQMQFIHDRMPVILDPGSDDIRTWLDPSLWKWSSSLQKILKPFAGELDIYPVSKDVGKISNDSPKFVIPLNSKENKSNIANFFSGGSIDANQKSSVSPKSLQTFRTDDTSLYNDRSWNSVSAKHTLSETDSSAGPPLKKMRPRTKAEQEKSHKAKKGNNKAGEQKITSFFK